MRAKAPTPDPSHFHSFSLASSTLVTEWLIKNYANMTYRVLQAVAVLSGDSSVVGTVTFTQSSALGPVTVSAKIKGLDKDAKRGFHIQ